MNEFHKEIEDYFCRFTFGQFVTLIILELVTLFFVFYLGAHYGPSFLRSETKTAGIELPGEGPRSVDEIVGKKVEYTFPEVLTEDSRGKDELQKSIRIKQSGIQGNEKKPSVIRDVPVAPVKELPTTPKVAAVKKSSGVELKDRRSRSGKYAIQVGSFQVAEEATASVASWKQRGYDAYMSVGQIPDRGTWYRVRIGGYTTRDLAKAAVASIKQKEKADALVVLSDK